MKDRVSGSNGPPCKKYARREPSVPAPRRPPGDTRFRYNGDPRCVERSTTANVWRLSSPDSLVVVVHWRAFTRTASCSDNGQVPAPKR